MYLPQAIGQNWFPGRNHEYYYYLLSSLFLFSMEPHVAQAGLELLIQLSLLLDSWSAGVRVHLCLGVCMCLHRILWPLGSRGEKVVEEQSDEK